MPILSWKDWTGSLDGSTGQTIGGVHVTVTGTTLSDGSFVAIRDWNQYNVNPGGADFATDSALKIYSGNVDTNTPGDFFYAERVELNFGSTTSSGGERAENVSFRLNTISGDQVNTIDDIVIRAFDANGNEIEVDAVVGSEVELVDLGLGKHIGSTDEVNYSGHPSGSALITVDGPVARIEVTYSMDQEVVKSSTVEIPTFVTMTDVHFDTYIPPPSPDPEVDHFRFPSEPIDLDPNDDRDSILGTPGDDSIAPGDDADTVDGGSGDDTIDGGWDDDEITGGGGEDLLIGGKGNDTIDGGGDNDTIISSSTDLNDHYSDYGDTPGGGTSYDDPKFDPSGIEGWFTDPNPDDDRDHALGRGGDDVIFTGDDADTLDGGDGNDTLDGGIDDDLIYGGTGEDSIIGGHGSDTIDGNDGSDWIDASSSSLLYPNVPDATDPFEDNDRDVVDGGTGDDTIYGGDDDDSLHGGTGYDEIYGGIDEDTISGGRQSDSMYGEEGDDLIFGYNHDDSLNGGEGVSTPPLDGDTDYLSGGEGDDTLYGGSQDDTLSGGEGADVMFGGEDEDWFVDLTAGDDVDGGESGRDLDTIDLRPVGVAGEIVTGTGPVTFLNPDGSGGTIRIEFDPLNSENGVVSYYDSVGGSEGHFDFINIENIIIPCFTPGTKIATPKGEVPVEELEVGDRIITRDNGIQEIRWLGTRDLSATDLAVKGNLRPVLIRKGALGNGLPERDMKVSPNHRMLVASDKAAMYFEEREVLVAAKHLTGLEGVDFVDVDEVTYIHFMFDQHEVVLSDGAWSESFQPGDYTLEGIDSEQREEILELFPELANAEGVEAYQSARRSLKRYEAQLLI